MIEGANVLVEDFGAVGDGVTDDHAAFTAAGTHAKEMGVFVLGTIGKTYYVSAVVTTVYEFDGRGCSFYGPNGVFRLDGGRTFIQVTADYVKGDETIQVDSTAGIEDNSILSIRSTDLFNDERTYYYKGINTKVTVKDATTLQLSHTMPFGIGAATLTEAIDATTGAYIAPTSTVQYKNCTFIGDGSSGNKAIYVSYATVTCENLHCVEWQDGLSIQRCVGVRVNNCTTIDCSQYGVILRSTTDTVIDGGVWLADWVAIDTGGNEPVYNLTINNVQAASVDGLYGVSFHNNMINAEINMCAIVGTKLAGHCVVNGGTLEPASSGSGSLFIHPMHEGFASFRFNQVDFIKEPRIRWTTDEQQPASVERNKADYLIFEDCTGAVSTFLALESTTTFPVRAYIGSVKNINSDVSLWVGDDVGRVTVDNAKASGGNKYVFRQYLTGGICGKVQSATIKDTETTAINGTIRFESFDKVLLEGIRGDVTDSSMYFNNLDNLGSVVIRDSDFGTSTSRIQSSGCGRMLIDNTRCNLSQAVLKDHVHTLIERDLYTTIVAGTT